MARCKYVVVLFLFFYSFAFALPEMKNDYEKELSRILSKPFFDMDSDNIHNIFTLYLKKENVMGIVLFDEHMQKNIIYGWKKENRSMYREFEDKDYIFESYKYFKSEEITYKGKLLGKVKVYYKNMLGLSPYEIDFLKDRRFLVQCVAKDVPPYRFYTDENILGIHKEIAMLIEQRINIPIILKVTKNFQESLNMLSSGNCDFTLTSNLMKYENVLLTSGFLFDEVAILTKMEKDHIKDLSSVDKVGILKEYEYLKRYILNKYPHIKLYEFESLEEGFKSVQEGKTCGFVNPLIPMIYLKNQLSSFGNLKVNLYLNEIIENRFFALNKGNLRMRNVLNKVIESIDQQHRDKILQKWILVKYKKVFDYEILIYILIFVGLVGVLFAYKQYYLRKINKELTRKFDEAMEKNREKEHMLYQQAKLASMGEMLSNIAHQWRQPLNEINSIVMASEYLMQDEKINNAKLNKKFDEIESQTAYMSQTITDFTNFFKPEKEKKAFKLSEAINDVLDIVQVPYENHGIEIVVQVNQDKEVVGFKGEYVQVLITILNNAKDIFLEKAIFHPQITIIIDNNIVVKDNAGGIDKDIIEKIFDPYFTTKHQAQGTGIGLYMAKMLIEKSMHGKLTVQNSSVGADFYIEI